MGWVRALAAAAIAPLLGWLTVVVMLSVLEPWLVTLAQERADNTLDPNTAMSVAALVFVFGAGQAALLVAAGVVAFGFRLPERQETERQSAAALPPQAVRLEPESRAQRLAFDLQRDQAAAAARLRPAHLATVTAAATGGAPAASPRYEPSERPARLGDAYRRPAAAPRPAGGRA
jgi:type IV secretion system protein VirB6